MKTRIRMGQYEFPNPEWSEVSEEGKGPTHAGVRVRARGRPARSVGLYVCPSLLGTCCLCEGPGSGLAPWALCLPAATPRPHIWFFPENLGKKQRGEHGP